ncbi:MAG: DHA2 family efflux MFS transporter permease subunit [Ilumatobacteraceae bacterium]
MSAVTAEAGAGEGLVLQSARGRVALVATVAASAMASLDATVVNVALPHIGKDFDASISSLQWVLTGYLVALASLILLGGALGDRFGRRKIFIVGTVWFALASLLCGAAPNIEVLVLARVLQGVGGALLTPGSLAILQASFRESDRAAAVGAWSGLGGVAGAIGPFVGGGLVDGPGWRWAFLINVPVAAIAIACARSAIPETRDPATDRSLDFAGAALAVVGLAVSTWALTEAGPRGWTDPAVLVAIVIASAAVVAFVRRMLHTNDPLVPPALFRDRTFTVVNLQTVLLYGALGVSFFLVSYELQVATGWSALKAGVALLPATGLMLLLSSSSGALAQRIGPRLQLTVGPLLAAGGLLLLTRVGESTSWVTDVMPGAIVFGCGLVTFVAPLTATVMAAADPNHVSVASGVNNAIARAAGLSALAVVPVVSGLTAATVPAQITHAFRMGLVVTACVAAAAGPLAFFGLGSQARAPRTARRVLCPLDGAPLQAEPEQ